MNGLLLVSALLLVFFAGTEQACLLGCSCQLDGVIDCRDLGLTALQTETEVVDRTVETILASDNSLRTVNVSILAHWYPHLKLLVCSNNAGLSCVGILPNVSIVGCPAELRTSGASVTTTTMTTTTSTITTTSTTTTTTATWSDVVQPFGNSDSTNVSHSLDKDINEPRWKTIVYVAVGTASAIFTVIAFVCLAKYAVLKYRKDPVIEFYSPRSLYNQTPVYTARLDETSPNDSGSFSD